MFTVIETYYISTMVKVFKRSTTLIMINWYKHFLDLIRAKYKGTFCAIAPAQLTRALNY